MTDTAKVDDAFAGILDTNLDDIDDLPEYLDYCSNGAYHLAVVESERKVIEVDRDGKKVNAPVVQVTYEIVEVKEVQKPEDLEQNPVKTRLADGKGSYFNESFFFDKDPKKTREIFKSKYKEVAAKFGWTTLEAVVEGLKGLELIAVVQSKKDDKKDKFWISTRNVMPL